MRKGQYLAAIEPLGGALVLNPMRFADEVVPDAGFRFPRADNPAKELSMAEALARNREGEFAPEKYADEYHANLLKITKAKMKGKKVTLKAAAEPEMTDVIDLQARLAASLKSPGKSDGATPWKSAGRGRKTA